MEKPISVTSVPQSDRVSCESATSEILSKRGGLRLRGRVLESIFTDPVYRQALANIIQKEWNSGPIKQDRSAALPEETAKDNAGAKQSGPDQRSAPSE